LPSAEVLGVRVQCLTQEALLDQVMAWAVQDRQVRPHLVSYVNANCLNLAATDTLYRAALNQADCVYTDGIGAVWAGRWLSGLPFRKITGRVWIAGLCERVVAHGLRVYVLAGQPGVAQQASQNLRAAWPRLEIVAARDGFFVECSEPDVLCEVAELRPQVLLVGMGVPAQEKWLAAHRDLLQVPVCWTVGALFDYVAGEEPMAPPWMDALGLEWLWRLVVDPRGKWRRYVLGNPQFVARLLRQKLGR
jgi:N-acetylglucosaminyldiphosphoundecaprenol N-acetyl-beta-D-mannosaminyltransferase